MRSKHSFAIDFIARKCKVDKTKAFIYARITIDAEPKEISIKEKIPYHSWDNKSCTVKGKGISVQAINKTIEDVRFRIKEKYRMLEDRGELITAETVKDAYLGTHTLQKGHKLIELLEYFRRIWEPKLRRGGFKNYKTTIGYIRQFLHKHYPSGDLYLSQLNMQTATEFEYYVRNSPIKSHDPCLGNGVAKHIQRFKRIINWAVEIEWMKSNPFEKYSCPLKRSKRKKLNFQQLVLLEQKAFQDATLNYVRDLFIFSCYTGFAFADVMALTKEDFEWDTDGTIWCKIYRSKSDILSAVPLLKSASEIVNRRKDTSRDTIFAFLSNQYVNRCLKMIQGICEFDLPLTFHVARHTFAKTVALKNGVPLETVQVMMGHTKITTTQIYADVDEEKIIDDMSRVEDRIMQKRLAVKAAISMD